MKEELFWSLLGGITATVFNVIYNYLVAARSRRWTVTAEITGKIDFYYLLLVKVLAQLESVFDDQQSALTQEEWRSMKIDAALLFVDEQKIRAEVDIVYGVDSPESNQFEEVFGTLKQALSTALEVNNKPSWDSNKVKLKQAQTQLATLRPEYRKRLVNSARLWPILNSRVTL